MNFTATLHLGVGTVFEVARVRDVQGRDLICKRAARAETAAAVERERDLLQRVASAALPARSALPSLVASGTDARGGFLVESRVAGAPLRDLIEAGTRLTPEECLTLARSCVEALGALHALADTNGAMNFVHGDISPDNLFFAPPATATFIDLSSATWRDAREPIFPDDRGTAPYAAPELLRQETHATQATDVYALAATLLAVIVGPPLVHATTEAARLLEAGDRGILWQRIDERADLPQAFRSALAEALQYEASQRLSSAALLAARLAPL